MSINNQEANHYINDPVPKNVSKFPIHQTYLTSDAEGTGNGGYKFKCPEVWSSARSGKKSIAIRSIYLEKQAYYVNFRINTEIMYVLIYHMTPPDTPLYDFLESCQAKFKEAVEAYNATQDEEHKVNYELAYRFHNQTLTFMVLSGSSLIPFSITDISNITAGSESLNIFLNQPKNYSGSTLQKTTIEFNNVWDRLPDQLHFHASFIPFDNYQYLGDLNDYWNNPIIYQDPNTSPLFNIWITTDLKTPIKILHEHFIFRFTFIISSESQYKA